MGNYTFDCGCAVGWDEKGIASFHEAFYCVHRLTPEPRPVLKSWRRRAVQFLRDHDAMLYKGKLWVVAHND